MALGGVLTACYGEYVPLSSGSTTVATSGTSTSATSTTSSSGPSADSSSTTSPPAPSSSGSSSSGGSPDCVCEQIDILMMVDERDAVNPYIENLASALLKSSDIIADALANYCDYHIGVTTTSVVPQNEDPCQAIGSLIQPAASCAALTEDRPYIIKGDDAFQGLGCLLSSPIPFDPQTEFSRPMDAMIAALSPEANAPGGCNEGFFRPGAPLVVLVATDIDDILSEQGPTYWGFSLTMLQEGLSNNVVVAEFVPTGRADRTCALAPADRLMQFASSFPYSEVTSICAEPSDLTGVYQTIFEELVPNACAQGG